MILYEQARTPGIRFGETNLAGRRIAVRALPYGGNAGAPPFRFDPIERAFSRREPAGNVVAGPFDPEDWRRALAGGSAGAVLVGPTDSAERIRGAYRAAVEGARLSGRAVYLWDPEPGDLPEDLPRSFVAVFVLLPDARAAFERSASASKKGISAGVLLPLIPGWTDSPEWFEKAAADAAEAGCAFLAPLSPVLDGPSRRLIVEARCEVEPASADGFFEQVHHGAADFDAEQAARRLGATCRSRGLATIPPRARGLREPAANSAAAARLEEIARSETHDEHRSALIHAGIRWIDELGRDLSAVARDGNLGRIFPFGPELAREAESAIAAGVDLGARAERR